MKKALTIKTIVGGALASAFLSIAVGCGGGGGGYGGGGTIAPPPASPTPAMPTIHLNLFGTANGVFKDGTFGDVTGFTQQRHAQVLGLPPGTQVIITNNDSVAHTFNVFSAFPTPGPQSTATVPNGGVLGVGYPSGPIQPGNSTGVLTVTNTTGDLFIICGIHYISNGMRDGMIVQVGATPGPQATPAPAPSGMCKGYGC